MERGEMMMSKTIKERVQVSEAQWLRQGMEGMPGDPTLHKFWG